MNIAGVTLAGASIDLSVRPIPPFLVIPKSRVLAEPDQARPQVHLKAAKAQCDDVDAALAASDVDAALAASAVRSLALFRVEALSAANFHRAGSKLACFSPGVNGRA
jgi:hypothetical protein